MRACKWRAHRDCRLVNHPLEVSQSLHLPNHDFPHNPAKSGIPIVTHNLTWNFMPKGNTVGDGDASICLLLSTGSCSSSTLQMIIILFCRKCRNFHFVATLFFCPHAIQNRCSASCMAAFEHSFGVLRCKYKRGVGHQHGNRWEVKSQE